MKFLPAYDSRPYAIASNALQVLIYLICAGKGLIAVGTNTARSSNGRTAAFEAVGGGSNPPRATKRRMHRTIRKDNGRFSTVK